MRNVTTFISETQVFSALLPLLGKHFLSQLCSAAFQQLKSLILKEIIEKGKAKESGIYDFVARNPFYDILVPHFIRLIETFSELLLHSRSVPAIEKVSSLFVYRFVVL